MARSHAAGPQKPQDRNLTRLEAPSPSDTTPTIADVLRASKPRKYRNKVTVVNGITFDSIKEADRYVDLAIAEEHGAIRNLEVHPRFPLVVHGQDCGVYEADFAYLTEDGERVIEDVKSAPSRKLPTYRLKRRLVWACYGLTIREV